MIASHSTAANDREVIIGKTRRHAGRPRLADARPSPETLQAYFEKGLSPLTRLASHEAIRVYERELQDTGVPLYPITAASVLEFIARFGQSRRGSTVRTRVLMLSYIAGLCGWGHPAHDPMVCAVMDDLCARSPKLPKRSVTAEDVATLLRNMPTSRPIERRDKALVTIFALTRLLPRQLQALKAQDVRDMHDGLHLGRTKTGFEIIIQHGDDEVTDPVRTIKQWLADLPDLQLPLLPVIRKDGTICSHPLPLRNVDYAIRDASKAILKRPLSARDLQRGLIIALADAGFSTTEIMQRCFFKNASSVTSVTGTRGQPFAAMIRARSVRRAHDE